MRYKYFIDDNKNRVICVSTFAGKAVRGVAKCSDADTFDVEVGKKLAKLRCDEKVAAKRVLRAKEKHMEALRASAEAVDNVDKMQLYYAESFAEFMNAREAREAFEEKLELV